jgi:hypothetical protein
MNGDNLCLVLQRLDGVEEAQRLMQQLPGEEL